MRDSTDTIIRQKKLNKTKKKELKLKKSFGFVNS